MVVYFFVYTYATSTEHCVRLKGRCASVRDRRPVLMLENLVKHTAIIWNISHVCMARTQGDARVYTITQLILK